MANDLLINGSWPPERNISNAFLRSFNKMLNAEGITCVQVKHLGDKSLGTCDTITIHWPEQVFWGKDTPLKSAVAAIKATAHLVRWKLHGIKLVWVVHNLKPHGDIPEFLKFISAIYFTAIAQLSDAVITLSPSTVPIVQAAIKFPRGVQFLGIYHPLYATPTTDRGGQIRQNLGIPVTKRVFGLIGTLRSYKGVSDLIRIFSSKDPTTHLLLAGKVMDKELTRDIADANCLDNITVIDRSLTEEEYEEYVQCCDYIVLPFSDTLHSGSIVHALSLRRPVITPLTPFSSDLQTALGGEWVRTYNGEITGEALDPPTRPPEGQIDLSIISEEKSRCELHELYRSLL